MSITTRLHGTDEFNENFRQKQNELTEHAQTAKVRF